MSQALPLLLAALLAAGSSAPGAGGRSAKGSAAARAAASTASTASSARGSPQARAEAARKAQLEEARAGLKALMGDRTKRRYHHHWDRAIQKLLAAGRGAAAGPVQLEAARARYALYRWSADESDREKALALAARAARAGVPQAATFAAAVRREAGDDRPPVPRPRAGPPRGAAPEPPAIEEEAATDPELEAAVAALRGPSAQPEPPPAGTGPATVAAVKTWTGGDYTRVAIYLDRWVGWRSDELPASGGAPRRLVLDLAPARLDGAASSRAVPGEQVDRVRTAQHGPDTVRVVLDLPGHDAIAFHRLDDPPRLIVDVGTRTAAREARIAAGRGGGAAEPAPATADGEGDDGPDRRLVRRVVVDAGHGGLDPGAIGPSRVREKDVTLAIARRLAARLEASGYEVLLTRKDDRYLALEERTALANTARGDLFVSIHANAHPRRNRSGVETYFLNVADDRYAARLAARENGLALDGQGDATRILTDLDAKASAGASRRLARLVQREVTSGVRALPKYSTSPRSML